MTKQPTNYELYSVYVQTITAAEQRRQQAARGYTSLVSVGIGLVAIASPEVGTVLLGLIFLVGLIWLLTIRYFRTLAQTKFEVVNRLEQDWDIKPFALEYEASAQLKQGFAHRIGSLTHIEMVPPILSVIGSAGFLLLRLSG